MLGIEQAINLLKKREVLILPTDTLYGLGAIAYNYHAVKKVFDLKKRNYLKPLPIHYGNIDLVKEDCIIDSRAYDLMQQYWPGALTIVLPKKESSKLKFVGDSVAVRVPNCKVLLNVLNKLDQPLVMPSANISNEENIFDFDILQKFFGISGIKDDLILQKEPSTIISFLDGEMKILRQGMVKIYE